MQHKICTKCGITKLLDSFPKQKKSKDGKESRCKICAAKATKRYRELNPHKVKETFKNHYKKYKIKRGIYVKQWMIINKDKRQRWRKLKADVLLEYNRKWRSENPDKVKFNSAKKRAAKFNAIPIWVNPFEIIKIYRECNDIIELTGEVYQVDHIVPLQGKTVCGLHVPWNLQIITRSENISKRNKLLVDQ